MDATAAWLELYQSANAPPMDATDVPVPAPVLASLLATLAAAAALLLDAEPRYDGPGDCHGPAPAGGAAEMPWDSKYCERAWAWVVPIRGMSGDGAAAAPGGKAPAGYMPPAPGAADAG